MRRPLVIAGLLILALALVHAPCGPGEAAGHPALTAAGHAEDCQEVRPAVSGTTWPVAARSAAPVVEPSSLHGDLVVGSSHSTRGFSPFLARPLLI